ncbi:MAG: hypothetical protein AB1634_19410, partial [Thermodesulfobacteriota bacterium]
LMAVAGLLGRLAALGLVFLAMEVVAGSSLAGDALFAAAMAAALAGPGQAALWSPEEACLARRLGE